MGTVGRAWGMLVIVSCTAAQVQVFNSITEPLSLMHVHRI